jgi:GT2 family glycosyltransferase
MLSIVILAHNQHAWVRACLAAVERNTRDFEIILVDNGSSPPFSLGEIPNYVARGGKVIRNVTNLGFRWRSTRASGQRGGT